MAIPGTRAWADVAVGGLDRAPLVQPEGEARGLVFLFSGEGGPDDQLRAAAGRIAGLGATVALVDTWDYLRRVRETRDADCLYLVSEIEQASEAIQARAGARRHYSPIVAGTGQGAAIAWLALAQAPAATLGGAAADGLVTRLPTDRPLCEGAEASPAPPGSGGFAYAPVADWPGLLRLSPRPGDEAAARDFVAQAGLGAETVVATAPDAPLPDRLATLPEGPIRAAQGRRSPLDDLPLVELPVTESSAAGEGGLMAVVLSGDGGWRDIDKQIAGSMQGEGVPVIGLDSLRYFWSRKTPEQVAADLGRVIDHYRAAWDRPRVLLVGFSFGADILPFAVDRLPEAALASVRQVSLLAPAPWADFEIRVAGWLGAGPAADSVATLPELARIDKRLIQCLAGADDADAVCERPELAGAERLEIGDGHHFGGHYEAVARAILEGAARRG